MRIWSLAGALPTAVPFSYLRYMILVNAIQNDSPTVEPFVSRMMQNTTV